MKVQASVFTSLIQLQTSQASSDSNTQDPLINRKLETDLFILSAFLLALTLFAIGIISRKIEHSLIVALFLSGILIALIMSLFSAL